MPGAKKGTGGKGRAKTAKARGAERKAEQQRALAAKTGAFADMQVEGNDVYGEGDAGGSEPIQELPGASTPPKPERPAKEPKPARVSTKVKVESPTGGMCWCGCGEGTRVGSRFLQGHDARLKGWLSKAESKEMTEDEIPNIGWLREKVFPQLSICAQCGAPYVAHKSGTGKGPYCDRMDAERAAQSEGEIRPEDVR